MIKSLESLTNAFVILLNGKKALAVTLDAGIASTVNKFGFNNDVDTAAPEDIWSNGGLYPYATFLTPQSLEVLSSSAADILTSGTGAWSINIMGLNANGAPQSFNRTLNGTGVVVIPGTWTAVNRAFILTTGSGGVNAGNINIRVAGGGQVVSQIPIGRGQTQQCVYRVPTGSVLRIKNIIAYTDASTGKTGSMQLIRIGIDCKTLRVLSSGTITEASSWKREYIKGGPEIESGAWVAVRALAVAQNDTAITADFDAELIEEE